MKRAVLALLLVAVAGCGTQASTSSVDKFSDPEQKAVAQQIEDLASAGKRNKPDDICSNILSQKLVSQLDSAGTDCATEMSKAIEDANEFDLQVEKVTVNGDSASAEVKQGDSGPTETMEFAKEKGSWRATSLSEAN
jgi:hypothetical protein